MQFLFRCDDDFALINYRWRLAAEGDSVIADGIDAHGYLLFPATASPPLVTPLPLYWETKATLYWIIPLRCSARSEHGIARLDPGDMGDPRQRWSLEKRQLSNRSLETA